MDDNKSALSKINIKNVAFLGIVIIFFVLLAQSAFALFVEAQSQNVDQIDIVFRTAISSIFGYVMSTVSTSEFVLKSRKKNLSIPTQPTKTIGFKSGEDKNSDNNIVSSVISSGEANSSAQDVILPTVPESVEYDASRRKFFVNLQIIILTLVCIFCLAILVIVRNFSNFIVASSSNIVTISMYRDIVSGSIGALIGLSRAR